MVKNHIKLKPLEVQGSSIGEVRPYFTQLEFVPIQSSIIGDYSALQDSGLIGGRYCSVQGVTAAQLRYVRANSSGSDRHIATLYQVAYDPKVHGKIPSLEGDEAPAVMSYGGLEVQLWVEVRDHVPSFSSQSHGYCRFPL